MKTLKQNLKMQFLLVILFIYASVASANEKVKITSPNGVRLFKTEAEMYSKSSSVLEKKFGKKQIFEITRIDYLQTTNGFVASVVYKLSSGEMSNYLICKDVILKKDKNGIEFLEKSTVSTKKGDASESNNSMSSGDHYVIFCAGSWCCSIEYNQTTGYINCGCNSECTVRIELLEEHTHP